MGINEGAAQVQIQTVSGSMRMVRVIQRIIVVFVTMHCSMALADDIKRVRFVGEGSGRTPAFETSGPWILDWSTRSDVQLKAYFDMRLHEGASSDFLGTIVQLEGTGSGRKLFDAGGNYQIVIEANDAKWELDVVEIDEAKAAEIRRRTEGNPSIEDSVRQSMRQLPVGSFSEWRPQGNDALLLLDNGNSRWRVSFLQSCAGLQSATAISFVTSPAGNLESYDSILLDDGTRCYFDRVIPAVAN